jgi:hypothetical protein
MPINITPEERENLLHEIRRRLRAAGFTHLDEMAVERLNEGNAAENPALRSRWYVPAYIREIRALMKERSEPAVRRAVADLNKELSGSKDDPDGQITGVTVVLPESDARGKANLAEMVPSERAVELFSRRLGEIEQLLTEGIFPENKDRPGQDERGPEVSL